MQFIAPFRKRLQAVVLDWAGTAVDYGCLGPVQVIVAAFQRFGISISAEDVRQFMGLMKKEHIRRICELPAVSARWKEKYGWHPGASDIEDIYLETKRLMFSSLANFAEPIPGLLDFSQEIRSRGIRIGSSTGYTRSMMDVLVPAAMQKGYLPDAVICSSDVPAGRPYPWMCYLNAIQLNVYPMSTLVKIGDSISDILEGRNAGMWTIGLTQSGNELGLTEEEVRSLEPQELSQRLQTIEARMMKAGAHYTAEGIWACLPILEEINGRIQLGETPETAWPSPARTKDLQLLQTHSSCIINMRSSSHADDVRQPGNTLA